MPYTYSGFHAVESGDTMQRAMPIAFPTDPNVREIADQFMWGDAFMVCPIVSAADDARSGRDVYLPSSTWIDFWTGETIDSGTTTHASAPLTRIPLFVKNGSIVVLGDFMQYANERPWDPLEVRIYGKDADAEFALYEDVRANTTLSTQNASSLSTHIHTNET